jgi:membrane fusion protein (multidrug efflux system)
MKKEDSPRGRRTLIFSGAVLIIIALAALAVLSERKKAYIGRETKERAAASSAGISVRVVSATRSPGMRTVTVAGEARPYATVTLYSKVSGYLKEIRVDKGDRVKEGQVMAVIESPELDRQYDAALADAKNKRVDAERFKTLVKKGYVSQQDSDNAETTARVAEANAESLREQKGYEILRAPFPATVTVRYADPGALVQSAATSQTNALPLVTLSQTERLRIYVYLDQREASFVHVGDRAEVSDPSRPGVRLSAPVSRMSGELDPKTRTLLTELDLDNTKGLIIAGSFVQVSLALRTVPYVEVPADAILPKGDKTFVAVIADGNKVNFRQIVVAESDGKSVKIQSGLNEGEVLVLNPGFGIAEGARVQPVHVTKK